MYPNAYNQTLDGHSKTEFDREKLRQSVDEITGVCPVEITNVGTGSKDLVYLEHHQTLVKRKYFKTSNSEFSMQSYLVSIRYPRESHEDDLVLSYRQKFGARPQFLSNDARQHYQFRK